MDNIANVTDLKDTFYYPQENAGVLRVRGPHQLDFLQRQVTNDMRLITPEKILPAVLTTPTARILDVFYIFLEELSSGTGQAPGFMILSIADREGATLAYLKSRIFFMDQVTVEDTSGQWSQIDVFGAQAEAVLQHIGFHPLPVAGEIKSFDLEGIRPMIFRHLQTAGMGFRLLAPAEDASHLLEILAVTGAHLISAQEYEIKRVEAGVPAGTSEFTEEFTPLEVNLNEAISDKKGCYTGQEVIARQITYDKVTRSLVGLQLESPALASAEVRMDGRPYGVVTSAVISPHYGPIALAVLRRQAYEQGTKVRVKMEREEVGATVVKLPFRH